MSLDPELKQVQSYNPNADSLQSHVPACLCDLTSLVKQIASKGPRGLAGSERLSPEAGAWKNL